MKRPYVALNVAMSADGKISSAFGESPNFVSRRDRRRMDLLRAEFDAVLIGAGTLRQDDPPLQLRDEAAKALRQKLGRPPGLTCVVVSASLDLPFEARFFRQPRAPQVIVASGTQAPWESVPNLAANVLLWRLGKRRVPWPSLLQRLKEAGVDKLLVEAAGEVAWQLVEAQAIDAWYTTVAPTLIGGRGAPTPLGGRGAYLKERRALRLRRCEPIDGEIFCHYDVAPAQ